MADEQRTLTPHPLSSLDPGGEPRRFEAVDRLIAMATEKRADRVPTDVEEAAETRTPASLTRAESKTVSALVLAPEPKPADDAPDRARRSAGETAGRVISRLRPMLPALAGALRLVDHGAIQALSRLLPLLAGSTEPAPNAGVEQSQLRSLAQLEARQREQQQELETLTAAVRAAEQQVAELRVQSALIEQQYAAAADKLLRAQQAIRLLTYAAVILVPMVIALVALFYAHLRTG